MCSLPLNTSAAPHSARKIHAGTHSQNKRIETYLHLARWIDASYNPGDQTQASADDHQNQLSSARTTSLSPSLLPTPGSSHDASAVEPSVQSTRHRLGSNTHKRRKTPAHYLKHRTDLKQSQAIPVIRQSPTSRSAAASPTPLTQTRHAALLAKPPARAGHVTKKITTHHPAKRLRHPTHRPERRAAAAQSPTRLPQPAARPPLPASPPARAAAVPHPRRLREPRPSRRQ